MNAAIEFLRDGLQRRLWLAFLLAASLAVIPALLVVANTRQLEGDRDAALTSYDNAAALTDVLVSLHDVQLGGLGYALTGEPGFLRSYEDGAGRLGAQLDELLRLTPHDTTRARQMEELARLAERSVEVYGQAIAMRDGEGAAAAAGYLNAGPARSLMEDQDQLVRAIRDGEATLVETSVDTSEAATFRVGALSGTLVVLSLALLGSTLVAASRALSGNRRAAEAASETAAIVAASSDAIVSTDEAGVIRSWNPGAEAMFGYSAEDAVGQHLSLTAPDRLGEEVEADLVLVKAGAPIMNQERIRVGKGGAAIDVSLSAALIRGAGGEVRGAAAIMRDITERKRTEVDLQRAQAAAERANQAKSTFLSRMSHELRTPLNVVLGFGQVLQLDPLEPGQAEAVDHILTAGRHLLELIDEVLDIAQIEAGRLSLSIEPVQIGEVVLDGVASMRTIAGDKGIELRVAHAGRDHVVLADRRRLKQVLLNLVSNAIKYSERGGAVEVSFRETPGGILRMVVADKGIGIEPEKMARLFTPFDRLGAGNTGVEGTGLGLSLSKYLVEAMNGAIGVESTPGEGSTFWVDLPATGAQDSDAGRVLRRAWQDGDAPSVVDLGPHTILYIEDNLANLKLMERILLEKQGSRLLAAMQGGLGLQLARDHRPDLILLDLHLPDMPGAEVLRELQADAVTRDIPVVIVSADATPGQAARLATAGARAYVTKPIDLRELLFVTRALLVGTGPGAGKHQ